MAKRIGTKVITNIVRFSYVHVFEKQDFGNGQKPAYSVQLLIPTSDKETLRLIDEAIEEAKQDGKVRKWGGKIPNNVTNPLRDGLEKADDNNAEVYQDMMFLNARSYTDRPGLLDKDGTELTEFDQDVLYSGCWGLASITFYPYDTNGNKGVGASLNNLKKKKDDERLGGNRASANSDFGDDPNELDEDDI